VVAPCQGSHGFDEQILRAIQAKAYPLAGPTSGRHYLLTAPREFGILQSGPGCRGPNAIRPIETTRFHHAAWQRGGGVAARGARALVRVSRDFD